MTDSHTPLATSAPEEEGQLAASSSRVTALVTVAEDASDQVRLMHGTDRAPMVLTAVRENAAETRGSLFLPRGCEVEVDFRCDDGFGGDLELLSLHVEGVVRKVSMVDSAPTYVLRIDLPADSAALVETLRAALEA